MTTEEKIEKISDFLHQPNNKLIWSKKETMQAGTYFDIELSTNPMNIDFSVETIVDGIEETVTILKSLAINKDLKSIRNEVENKLKKYNINPNDSFHLAIKGNRDERMEE